MFGLFKKKPKQKTPQSREEILAQAQKNAAKARNEIGEENLQRMAEALRRMDDPNYQSAGKSARDTIRGMDKGKVADNLKIMLDEERNR